MALVEADVIGPFRIVDALTGEDVAKGGTVVLDDEATNVPALVGVHVDNVRVYEEPKADEPADDLPALAAKDPAPVGKPAVEKAK